jgi:hypothetical protein
MLAPLPMLPMSPSFPKALLLPPFADLLALVNTTLFLCGAAEQTSVGGLVFVCSKFRLSYPLVN